MPKKDSAAVKLGRRGGKATAKKRTAEQRKEAARKAARARQRIGNHEQTPSVIDVKKKRAEK
ncbi:MAG: hypothetical protein DMG74_01400 [Acidobacteria bacterium]|nr:MAG: hypothetical protein DMG74_01400 [Acidobacteriota bacterium]